jgi:hypothetical protein
VKTAINSKRLTPQQESSDHQQVVTSFTVQNARCIKFFQLRSGLMPMAPTSFPSNNVLELNHGQSVVMMHEKLAPTTRQATQL